MVATNPHKVNFHDDVFYVSDSPGENTIIVEFKNDLYSSVNSDLIKTIAIPVLDLIYYTEVHHLKSLLELQSLEEIILIEGSRPLPKESNKPRSVTTRLRHMLIPPRIEPPSWLEPYDEARIVDPQDVNPVGIST